jgi:hypothetical protein
VDSQSEDGVVKQDPKLPNIEHLFHELTSEWEDRIKNWLKEGKKDVGSYLWPLRVHLSGKTKSPSPFELLAIQKTKV